MQYYENTTSLSFISLFSRTRGKDKKSEQKKQQEREREERKYDVLQRSIECGLRISGINAITRETSKGYPELRARVFSPTQLLGLSTQKNPISTTKTVDDERKNSLSEFKK